MVRVVCSLLNIVFLLIAFEVDARNKDSLWVGGNISIQGNEQTVESIILREVPFETGDTIYQKSPQVVSEIIENNLMNTELFNFVSVNTEHTPNNSVDFVIKVEERWYLWPSVYLDYADRNINSWWKKKDFQRLNYQFGLLKNNFRGRREELGVKVQGGYEEKIALKYEIPYINKTKTLGLMFLGKYNGNHTVAYGSLNNELHYLNRDKDYLRENLKLSLSLKYRPNIHTRHQFTVGWRRYIIADTLNKLNESYSFTENPDYMYFSYIVKLDYRDYKAYPLNGFYLDFAVRKFGLPSEKSDATDYSLFKTNFRKYFELASEQWFFSAGLVGQKSVGKKLPYYLIKERGMGYERDFVRGMEYYVLDSENWIYMKTNLKKRILQQKIFRLEFLENNLFGKKFSKIPIEIFVNAFYDAGYAKSSFRDERANPLFNSWQEGLGLGVDIVTYYDKVLRTELSWNHLGDYGLYFHIIAPI